MCTKEKLIEAYRRLSQEIDQEKKEKFYQIQEKGFDCVDDHIVKDSNICILLSCPGEEEMLAQKPAAGQTGKNLFDIMKKVYKSKDFDHNGFEVNEDGDQYQFSIINAYNHVYFRLVNGPEPKEEVILEKKNIDRIKKSISKITNKKYLIVCGNNAETLVNNNPCVFNWSHIAKVAHIGNVGIRNTYPNSYKYDGDKKIGNLPQEQRDQKRYEIIANNIIEQFKKYNK